jgi:SagB-type dehydrogenase family enzyme
MKTLRPCARYGWVCVLWAAWSATGAPPPDPVRGVHEMAVEQRRVFLKGTQTDWRRDTDDARGLAAPPIEKPYPLAAKRVDLVKPDQFKVGGMRVIDALRNRRSRREYSGDAFSLEELSYLLWAAQGISRIDRDGEGKVLAQFRTVPSGGARHPFETYLIVNRVAGVAPGLYRYLPVEHQLLVMREDPALAKRVSEACYGQAFTGKAAVVFVWSAIPYRTAWHYGCIAEKLVAIDAGHVCQNLYLAAESIQGGVCAVLGYDQARMDALIGLDGSDEFTLYLATAGKLHDAAHP